MYMVLLRSQDKKTHTRCIVLDVVGINSLILSGNTIISPGRLLRDSKRAFVCSGGITYTSFYLKYKLHTLVFMLLLSLAITNSYSLRARVKAKLST